ncbi:helix-turn-helix domain-containing protein [Oceanirhabdus sp. W0125-5]|uniref:helix-turn-helix domain-containing protein n=1 Tax=Oceanirhabdus sp. W0125-5 TaxID=2999116 RepID=UPI0022F2C1F2|nr:MerR family transcriptional regulator [Oceanirhabdus sp. W0125-5]WBW96228.1 MerR family transcriptional regulator [Oceanirhabdus sp. W0125-5]
MREYLTIGEVSKLLNISAYNIRYYEKEGLVKASHVSDSGYRLYSYEDVYILNTIIILRESGLSIKEVKKLINNYNKESYIQAMKKSYEKLDKEINRLKLLKDDINESLEIIDKYEKNKETFSFKDFPERRFVCIKKSDYEMDYSIKEIYDICDENRIDMSVMYKRDFYYILEENQISVCLLDDNQYNLKSMIYKKGKYLRYSFFVNNDMEIEGRMEEMFEYINKNNIEYEGDPILIIGLKASMISESGYIGELQIKIK